MDQCRLHDRPLVFVVDDDLAVRRALEFALDLEGFAVETYESGEALLLREPPNGPTCLVLDERLPGITGLGALNQLRQREVNLPAILITTHPGPALRAAAAKAGVPILEKPVLGDTLVAAINAALHPAAPPEFCPD
ncbi:response regulator [Phenylobacterium sp.]|uniref:response regulator transcription factor n=1 Tax=Phenylobacterium sp. TaxID=1871053 RepID=UPI0025E987DF|nr:response regulator [Phenylobacterium sp.]